MQDANILKFFWDLFLNGVLFSLGVGLVSSSIMLPYFFATKKSVKTGVDAAIIFLIGRLSVYMTACAIAGLSTDVLYNILYKQGFVNDFRLYFGFFILLLGLSLIIAGFKNFRILKFFHDWDKLTIFFAGILLGLVPNAIVLSVISSISITLHSYILGLLAGLIFGLGTLFSPFLIFGGLFGFLGGRLEHTKFYISVKRISGAVTIFLALKMILTALLLK